MKNFLVLSSSGGSTFQATIDAMKAGDLTMPCLGLLTNEPEAGCVKRARDAELPLAILPREKGEKRVSYDRRLDQRLREMGATTHDTVIALMGWMRILSPEFLEGEEEEGGMEGNWQVLNVHPALLPKHAGLMDLAVHESVIAAGDTESGATIHKVTKDVDQGPIIAQPRCKVLTKDPTVLRACVQELERTAFWQVLQGTYTGTVQIPS